MLANMFPSSHCLCGLQKFFFSHKDEMGLLKMLNKYVDCSCGHPPEKEREKKHEAGGGSEKARQRFMRLAVSQLSLAS